MNWGNKIVLAFVLFAGFIGYMVTRAFQEDFDLVAENYYEKEINYQQKLEKLANTESAGKKIAIEQGVTNLTITFPEQQATGTIEFYHPSRKIFDKTFEISLTNGAQLIAKEDLVPGNYRVNISWNAGGQDFLQESKIFIQ